MSKLAKHLPFILRFTLILGLALPSVFVAEPVALAQAALASFKSIRTISTGELGVPHPTGFAFLPEPRGFLLWGNGSNPQEVQLISNYEDSLGSLLLPVAAENPAATAFDRQSNSLFMLNESSSELIRIDAGEHGLPNTVEENPGRWNARAFGVQEPQGMAFDPSSGRMFILDGRGPGIVSVEPHPSQGFDGEAAARSGRISRVDILGFEGIQFRGLALNPRNSHLYLAVADQSRIYEFTQQGEYLSVLDLSSSGLTNLQSLTFAPSADQTDDPETTSLFVLDGGQTTIQPESSGQILEVSVEPQALPPGTTLLPTTLVRTFSTSNAVWTPSSPDPSGIDYWPLTGRLLISDSEVDEMSNYFTGDNVFDSTLSGTLADTCSTTNLSRTGFANEPSGLAINPSNNRVYFADDDKESIFEVGLGPDNTYCTADDIVTSKVINLQDGDDVAVGNNTVFIAGGIDAEVYMFSLGANGVLGGDDGPTTSFDTGALGFSDLEGIGYNVEQGTLFIVSTSGDDTYLGEVTTTGSLLRAYDLSFMGTRSNLRSDVAYAPGSQNANGRNIYIVSRGVDNGSDPNENDGKVWEVSLIASPTATPSDTPLPTFTTTPGANNPFLASFTGNGTVSGVSFADEDIVRFDGTSWSLFFDGSDVGVGGYDLVAFEWVDADTLLMSFNSSITIGNLTFSPQDVVQFDATSLGALTAGTFSMYFDGSDVALSSSGEKIDALSLLPDGRVLLSTTANVSVPGVSGYDEDILAFTPTTLGEGTTGSWSLYFDGSDVALADTNDEDVDAVDVTSNGSIYLSTLGNFAVTGLSGADEDVFVCVSTTVGNETVCNYSSTLYFDGSALGLASNGLDGFNVLVSGPAPTPGPTNTPTDTRTPTHTATATRTGTPTFTPTQTSTPTATFTATETYTPGPTATNSSTPTNTATPSSTSTPTRTFTSTWTPTTTSTSTPGPTFTSTSTVMPSPTSAAPNLIFADGFESGDFSAWSGNVTNNGNLSVSQAAALGGSYGLQVNFSGTTVIYVRDDSPSTESRYQAQFSFYPNSISMANGNYIYLLQGHDTSNSVILLVQFYRSSAGYQLRIRAYDSVLRTWVNTPYVTIANTPHTVELQWANDGNVNFWVDGVGQGSLTGINNGVYKMESIRLGATYVSGTGISGLYFIDDFQSRR
jgi:uncharacterized protein YjiK